MTDVCILCVCFFFFFKQKTAYEMRISDWSSDVCSSDLFPRPPLLRGAQHFIGGLDRLEAHGRLRVAGLHVGMIFLRQTPPAFLYRVEIGVILQLQRLERVHLVPRAAAVARSAPAMIGAVLIAARVAPLRQIGRAHV